MRFGVRVAPTWRPLMRGQTHTNDYTPLATWVRNTDARRGTGEKSRLFRKDDLVSPSKTEGTTTHQSSHADGDVVGMA